MLKPALSNRFKKNYALMMKRGLDVLLLDEVVDKLLNEQPLEERYRDHFLHGNWEGYRECHIKGDWLLIYRILDDTLYLDRTGSHSDILE